MKNLFLSLSMLALLTAYGNSTQAQQTLNVAGHSAKIDGMTFDYSIGEMTLVSTERNATLIVTQGFLQPDNSGSGTDQVNPGTTLNELADRINVYPNPTQNLLFVETNESFVSDYAYQLFEGTGKVVLSQEGKTVVGSNRFTLDMSSLASGTYYLMVRKAGKTGEAENFSFKIQKIQ